MNAFATALGAMTSDPNVGMDIVYHLQSGSSITCRAVLGEPDIEAQLVSTRLREHKRVLIVPSSDVAQPSRGDTVEAPAGTAALRVMDYRAADAQRTAWKIEVADQ